MVVSAFDQDIRLDRLDQFRGCIAIEDYDQVHRAQTAQHCLAILLGIDRTLRSFPQSPHTRI